MCTLSTNLRILDREKERCMREMRRFSGGKRGKKLAEFLQGIKNEIALAESIVTYEKAKIGYLRQ